MVDRIERKLAWVAGVPVAHLESLAMVKYEPGEFFKIHHDGKNRLRTVFIYLNDLPEGDEGETHFPNLGVKFTPRRGSAIVWGNVGSDGKADRRMLHEALAPRTGVKLGVNCFFNEEPLR